MSEETTPKQPITIKRSLDEQEADRVAAEKAGLSVHAWRCLVLNVANGLSNLGELVKRLGKK